MYGCKLWLASFLGFILFGITASGGNDLVKFRNACGNCTVSNGLGFNSFDDDCSCFWTCVLKKSVKLRANPANDYVSFKKCCPCNMTWSQKLLTCVYFGNKQSDCFRGSDAQNPCFGVSPGSFLPRTDPEDIGGVLCNGYVQCLLKLSVATEIGEGYPRHIIQYSVATDGVRSCTQCLVHNDGWNAGNHCIKVGDKVVPSPNCCPKLECYDPNSPFEIPCTTAACQGECEDSHDCKCDPEQKPEKECPFMAVENDVTKFMGVELMATYSCAPGTCWSDEFCTCVQANNTGYNDCNLWLEMNFDDGTISAANGFLWIVSEGTTIAAPGAELTPFYAQFDGDGDYINTVALANAYIGNTFVFRFWFQLQNNGGVPEEDELQTLVTNCYDDSGNGFEDPTIDVCVFRRGGTGSGTQVTTMVKFNKGWYMLGDTMDTATVNLFAHLQVGVWYEYWLIYCGDDDLMFNALLDESKMILDARSYPVTGSDFVVISQSGFVFGQSLEFFKMDYDGGVDEVRLYRCKPFDDQDFNDDFQAIQNFVNQG